jgi:hypothetical protein
MAMVEDIAAKLLDEDGQPLRGAQTRSAEALQIFNARPTNRNRILQIIEELQRRRQRPAA